MEYRHRKRYSSAVELSYAIVIFAVIQGLIFITLLLFILSERWRRSLFRTKGLPRQVSRIEQILISETISSCVLERDLDALVRTLCTRAALLNGFEEWVVWLRSDEKIFQVAGAEKQHPASVDKRQLDLEKDPFLDWIRNNATPMVLESRVTSLPSSEHTREVLKSMTPGLIIPFMDSESLIGFIIVGGERKGREERSEQFLSLFGAFAAIIIKKAKQDLREKELLQIQRRAENLAVLGSMAARLAHEIRNPLTFIRSAIDCLHKDTLDENKKEALTSGVAEEVDRINQRVEELLSLGRIDPQHFTRVELGNVLNKTVKLAEATAKERGISITTDLDSEETPVHGDADKLWQLFENLIINGIQAMDDGGEINIKKRISGNNVLVEVRDSGPGIDQETAEKIFDPFFSTKEKGTGLGLAIGFSIARAHGGSLELLETSDEGSCFRVALPLIAYEPSNE